MLPPDWELSKQIKSKMVSAEVINDMIPTWLFAVADTSFPSPALVFLLLHGVRPAGQTGHAGERVRGGPAGGGQAGGGAARGGPGGSCRLRLRVGWVWDVGDDGFPARDGRGIWGRGMTQVVVLQPAARLPVNHTGRSDGLLWYSGVSLDRVQTLLLSLALRHRGAAHRVQVLFLGVVVPPPLLLALVAGGSSTSSVRGAAASPLTGGCEVSGGWYLVLAVVSLVLGLVCHLVFSLSRCLTCVAPL